MHPHHIKTQSGSRPEEGKTPVLRLVAWETTRNCNLNCVHCRAAATRGPYSGELDTPAALRLLDQIAAVGRPIVILTCCGRIYSISLAMGPISGCGWSWRPTAP